MNQKNILITGGTGHIGNRLVKILLDHKYNVTLLIRRPSKIATHLESLGASLFLCNLSDQKTYKSVLKDKDVAFHLAALNTTETSNEKETIKNTHGITKEFISACIENKVQKIIYTSSIVVLGRSKDKKTILKIHNNKINSNIPYVKGKIKAENWIKTLINDKTDIRIVYPSWVVGSGYYYETPPNSFLKKLYENKNRFCLNGGVSVAFIDDVAYGHFLALVKGTKNGKYILGGHNLEFREIYNQISKIFGRKNKVYILPDFLIKFAAKLLGKFSPIDAKYANEIVGSYSWYDSRNSFQEIGYKISSIKKIFNNIERDIIQKELRLNIFNFNKTKTKILNPGKNLLITGFPGWLANRTVEKIIDEIDHDKQFPFEKIILLVQEKFIKYLPKLPNYFEIRVGDLTDQLSLNKALKEVSCVWHFAGTIYPKTKESHYIINEKGTENLALACINNEVKRFLYMSTDSVCGFKNKKSKYFDEDQIYKPYKDYGRSKFKAEKILLNMNKKGLLEVTIFRGFWFFGPNMPERNKKFIKSFLWPYQIVFGNGKNFRSITHLDDVINAFMMATNSSKTIGKWYWITSLKKALTVNHIYREIGDAIGKKVKPIHIPNLICELISLIDILYTKITHKINPTLLAAGKFHKNIAIKQEDQKNAKKDFEWESTIFLKDIKDELNSEI